MDTNTIIKGAATIIIAILSYFVIPILQQKQGTEKVKKEAVQFDHYVKLAQTGVAAADQFFDKNSDKKTYVVSFLKSVGVPEQTIDAVTEAAVKDLKTEKAITGAVAQVDSAVCRDTGADVSADSGQSAFTVVYDANGADSGAVPTDANTYAAGASAIVAANTGSLAKSGYIFAGWNTAADGSGTACQPRTLLTSSQASVTLYAVWAPAAVQA